jgi:hypothetical protein
VVGLPYRYILGCDLGVQMFEGEWRSETGGDWKRKAFRCPNEDNLSQNKFPKKGRTLFPVIQGTALHMDVRSHIHKPQQNLDHQVSFKSFRNDRNGLQRPKVPEAPSIYPKAPCPSLIYKMCVCQSQQASYLSFFFLEYKCPPSM